MKRGKKAAESLQSTSTTTASSIRVVSNRTGLTPDTLRVWERRYGFPKPRRRDDGIRIYEEEDIVRLELIARAIALGWRPNEVVALPLTELRALSPSESPTTSTVGATSDDDAGVAGNVDSIIDALARDDLPGVRTLLRAAAIVRGPRLFVTDIAHPLALRVGKEWAEGRLAVRHEHLLTAALTMQLNLLLGASEAASSSSSSSSSPLILLATLPGEAHALPLDMVAVYLAARHATPRILGPNTPAEEIIAAANTLRPRAVGISISLAAERNAATRAVGTLSRGLPDRCELWVGGEGAIDLTLPQRAHRIGRAWSDVDTALERL